MKRTGNQKLFFNLMLTASNILTVLTLAGVLIGESGRIKPPFCGCYGSLRQCTQGG